eukprot:scaffold3124_cov390-Prasinococcus_capsulatus_cf.AAC.4
MKLRELELDKVRQLNEKPTCAESSQSPDGADGANQGAAAEDQGVPREHQGRPRQGGADAILEVSCDATHASILGMLQTATLDARTEELAQLRGACAATQAQLLLLQKGQQLAGLGIGEDADASADTAENTAGVGGEIPKEAGDYEYVYE